MSKKICGAKTRSGGKCQNNPVTGRNRCRMHGGKSAPAGITHHNYKTGRYSKAIPARLRARYEESLADPELLSLRSEVSLTDTRLTELMERAAENTAGSEKWAEMRLAILNLEAILNDRSSKKSAEKRALDLRVALEQAKKIAQAACGDGQTWKEIESLLDLRRKLTDTEQKRLERMNQFITAQEAFALIGQVLESIKRHIPDPQTRSRIASDIQRLMAQRG
jgi:hypothetical protein